MLFRTGVVSTQYHLAYNLLQTRRAVHDEVADIIYAENHFIASGALGFSQLRCLPPRACAMLSSLTVYLCVEVARSPFSIGRRDDLTPIPLRTVWIAGWQEVAAHVLAHTNREAFELFLIYDTGHGEKETTGALQPLLDHPGSVRHCHIRLSHVWNRQLCSLARDVALRAQGPQREDDDGNPFRFMDLPSEIQLKILEYTDLMTPLKQVEWRADRGFNAVRIEPTVCGAGSKLERELWLQSNQCVDACDTRHNDVVCNVRHSGYSSRCQCWRPPGATIMLVSRAMYHLAMATLYGRNRVILLPGQDDVTALLDLPSTDESDEPDESDGWEVEVFHPDGRVSRFEPALPCPSQQQLGAAIFLGAHHHTLQAAALSHLRTLEIVFPRQGCGPFDATLLRGWRDAVRHLREHGAAAEHLTIIVHMRVASLTSSINTRMLIGGGDDQTAFEKRLATTDDPLRGHAALLEPLRELREGGLRRLFIFLESDWHWSPPQGCTLQSCEGCQSGDIHDVVRDMEQVLEKSVMGQEYDSSEGKMLERPCQWMLRDIPLD